MQLNPTTLALVAAGIGLIFFPQLKTFFAGLANKGGGQDAPALSPSATPRPKRSEMLVEILDLQDKAAAMGITVAFEELGKAAIAIIGGPMK